MSEEEITEEDAPKEKSKKPLIIGLVLALAGGGGGFYAVQSGLLLGKQNEAAAHDSAAHDSPESGHTKPTAVFVPVDPLIINLGSKSENRFLRFRAQLEVDGTHEAEVSALIPRVLDVLNGYLRAVDVKDLEDPSSLIRLRAQMLRRIQMVTGEGRVKDLLIMEFVLN